MNLLGRLERRLEEAVEGFFSRRFSGKVHPVEIARRLARVMETERFVGISQVYAPNDYQVYLHPRDFAPFEGWQPVLVRELTAYLGEQVVEMGFRLLGPLTIQMAPREEVSPGQVLVEARLAASAETAPGGATADGGATSRAEAVPAEDTRIFMVPRAPQGELVVLDGADAGARLVVLQDAVTIGRRADCALVLRDRRVSRVHARVERTPEGLVVVDLGSTNGTRVNGRRVDRHRLAPGDRLVMGETTLEFRDPGDRATRGGDGA